MEQKNIKVELEQYYEKLKYLSALKKIDGMSELTVEVQDLLVNEGYLTEELLPTSKETDVKDIEVLRGIFLDVRRDYQKDEESVSDFSYLGVAQDWLDLKILLTKEFEKLVEFNSQTDHEEMEELMYVLKSILVNQGHLTGNKLEIIKVDNTFDELERVKFIFDDVMEDHRIDTKTSEGRPYLRCAREWLSINNIEFNKLSLEQQ